MKVTEKMLKRYETLCAVKGRNINLKIVSLELNLSYRQTLRLGKRFKEEGMKGLSYRRIHPAHNRIKEEIVRKVAALKKSKYPDFNISHFTEWLEKEEGIKISREKVRKVLINSGLHKIWEGKRRKPRVRFEASKSGILLQTDSSPHQWIPDLPQPLYLVLTLDDHSRKILAGHFFDKDSSYNNMLLLKKIVRKYGIFHLLYTDNASKFKYLRNKPSLYFNYKKESDDVFTQIDRALSELNIRLTHTPPFEPQGRGKIERFLALCRKDCLRNLP